MLEFDLINVCTIIKKNVDVQTWIFFFETSDFYFEHQLLRLKLMKKLKC